MNRIIILIFGFLTLQSCNQERNKKEDIQGSEKSLEVNPNNKSDNLQVENIDEDKLPESIKVKGDLLLAEKWNDKNGENILIISRKGPLVEENFEYSEDEKFAQLYAEQYIKKDNQFEILWDIYDFERNCPFDLWVGNLPNSTQITDLDNDGITETTVIYKLTCRSDYSPSAMKLIMHENDTKMALRGTMILDKNTINGSFECNLSKVDTSGLSKIDRIFEQYGRYSNEDDFKNKPSVFLTFAKEQWKKFVDKDEFKQL